LFNFRKVVKSDFPKLYNWLKSEHVKDFWYPDSTFTFEEISTKYSKRLNEGIVDIFIIILNHNEIGYIQSYFIDDNTFFKTSGLGKGIDLYIGEADFIHVGYGKTIITDYIREYVFNNRKVNFVGIDPEINNVIAIKAYEKAGFKHVNTEIDKYSKKLTYYMVMERT